MEKTEVPIGTKFGDWTTLTEKYKLYPTAMHYSIDCICKCGTKTTVAASYLTSGRGTRCWKCYNHKGRGPKLSPREKTVRVVMGWYQKSARNRDIFFNLTQQDFDKLLFLNCHYCGKEPCNKMKDRNRQPVVLPRYGGIDRVDNNIGYVTTNVVPCCRWCNESKRAKTMQEWNDWIEGLIRNQSSHNRASS